MESPVVFIAVFSFSRSAGSPSSLISKADKGHGQLMIPETIECRGYRRCNRSEGEYVEVEKLGVCGELKILVGDIAPADDRRLIVDGERFVVHAPVRAS